MFIWIELWCNDEFRHGEAFALLMRVNPHLLSGLNRLWIRFFQLAVYATMYVRDHGRPAFHKALRLDPTEYDYNVFRICRDISEQVFPDTLDIDDPRFRIGLDRLRRLSELIYRQKASKSLLDKLKLPIALGGVGLIFLRLYLLPARSKELPAMSRMEPIW